MVETKPQTVKSNFTDLISFFIWKKLAEQTNWQYIKLILNLQAYLILFQGVLVVIFLDNFSFSFPNK